MGREWQKKNPERWRAIQRAWNERNRDKMRAVKKAYGIKYRAANKERLAAAQKEKWQEKKHAVAALTLWRAARRRAKKSGLEFTISVDDVPIPEACPVLGIPLYVGDGKQGHNSPSIDRIDNTKGYVPENVWVVSLKVNLAKGALTPDEIILVGTKLKEALGGQKGSANSGLHPARWGVCSGFFVHPTRYSRVCIHPA